MRRLSVMTLLLASILPMRASAQADFVVHGADIYTANPDQPRAQAMAVRGDRILMVGSNEEILSAYPETRRLDYSGSTVIPGLIDAHAHLMGRAETLLQADLVGTASKEDVVDRLNAFAERLPANAWITGRGWDQNDWPDTAYPTRFDLDRAFPDRPVWLRRIDGHAGWTNTAALRAAGIDRIRTASDPEGGRIVRNADGEPTGVFIDTAMRLIDSYVPDPSRPELAEGLQRALQEAVSYGLTGVHDAGIGDDEVALYKDAVDAGRFPLRLYGMTAGVGELFDRLCGDGPILGYGDRLTVRSVKLYADGALGSRGAALLKPYADEPSGSGLLRMTSGELQSQVERAMTCGFQVNTHAIGDRGNRIVLDAYEAAMDALGRTAGRHRIEHAQIVHPDDIRRFRELGVIASMQPTHATSDMYWAEDRLGKDRLEGAYAWRAFLDAGVRLAFGSDFPVEEVNPLLGFYAAVTRQDAEGRPDGGWLAHQRVTRLEALHAFTIGAAYAAFMETETGSLEAGKLADFVVLSSDIMTVPVEDIMETRVVATFLGGEAVYASEAVE